MRKIDNTHGGKRIMTMIVSNDETYENAIIASGGEDNAVRIWGVKSAKIRHELIGHKSSICKF